MSGANADYLGFPEQVAGPLRVPGRRKAPEVASVVGTSTGGPLCLTLALRHVDNRAMGTSTIDFTSLRKALGWLTEALALWHAQPDGSVLKPHLRSAVIQSFEYSYELSLRSLRRVLIERAGAADRITDLSFNELLRSGADAGLLGDPTAWRTWRELRNATSHAYDEAKAQQVAADAEGFCADAKALLAAMETVR